MCLAKISLALSAIPLQVGAAHQLHHFMWGTDTGGVTIPPLCLPMLYPMLLAMAGKWPFSRE